MGVKWAVVGKCNLLLRAHCPAASGYRSVHSHLRLGLNVEDIP